MKKIIKVLIVLIAFSLSMPTHAQLGDLFRKLGDAIDSLGNKPEKPNQNEQVSKKESEELGASAAQIEKDTSNSQTYFDTKDISIEDIKKYMVGKWGDCNNNSRKNGTFIFIDEKKQLNTEFYRDGNLVVSTTYSLLEKNNSNNKSLLIGTGRIIDFESKYYKEKKLSRPLQTVWDLSTQDSIRVIDRTIWQVPEIMVGGGGPKVIEIKDGKLRNGDEVISYEKCKSINSNAVATSNPAEINNRFGIKGLRLGGALPDRSEIKVEHDIKEQLDPSNISRKIFFKTTIFEIPFMGVVITLNDQIQSVVFINIFDTLYTKYEYEYSRTRKVPSLSEYDFGKISNDIVAQINASLGSPKGQPKTSVEKLDKPTPHECVIDGIFVGKAQDACLSHTKLFNQQCRNCIINKYEFDWEKDGAKISIRAQIPDSKDMPFFMNSIIITYHDITLNSKFRQLENLKKSNDDLQKKRNLEKETQIKNEIYEKRKKDF